MTETATNTTVYERAKPYESLEAREHDARQIALSAVVFSAVEAYQKRKKQGNEALALQPGDTEAYQNTRAWLGLITVAEGCANEPIKLPDEEGKRVYVAVSEGGAIAASFEGHDLDGFEQRRVAQVLARDGTTVTVALTNEDGITGIPVAIPLSVLQEAAFLGNPNPYLAGLEDSTAKKVANAYLDKVKGNNPDALNGIAQDELKEAARAVPGIRASSAGGFIDKILSTAETGQLTDAQREKLDSLKAMKERLAQRSLCSADDMAEILSVLVDPEITKIQINDLNTQIEQKTERIKELKGLMVDLDHNGEGYKSLGTQLKAQELQLRELVMQRNLLEDSGSKGEAVEQIFESVAAGLLPRESIDALNTALEQGDMQALYQLAVKELDTVEMDEEAKKEARKKAGEALKKGLLLGGGIILLLIFAAMQGVKSS